MLSLSSINWSELTQKDKFIIFVILGIILIVCIIDYFYQKHKKKTKNDKI